MYESASPIATIITNGYLLTPERIRGLNRAGLDYLQISIDNVQPDEVSKKSLKVLDKKLRDLAEYADFDVTINSVLGSAIDRPQDAYQIATRARELGFNSTVGVIHDGSGQLQPLHEERQASTNDFWAWERACFRFRASILFKRISCRRRLISGIAPQAAGSSISARKDWSITAHSSEVTRLSLCPPTLGRLNTEAGSPKDALRSARSPAYTKRLCSTTSVQSRGKPWESLRDRRNVVSNWKPPVYA